MNILISMGVLLIAVSSQAQTSACVDISGNWSGQCTEGDNKVFLFEKVIKQDGCKSISESTSSITDYVFNIGQLDVYPYKDSKVETASQRTAEWTDGGQELTMNAAETVKKVGMPAYGSSLIRGSYKMYDGRLFESSSSTGSSLYNGRISEGNWSYTCVYTRVAEVKIGKGPTLNIKRNYKLK